MIKHLICNIEMFELLNRGPDPVDTQALSQSRIAVEVYDCQEPPLISGALQQVNSWSQVATVQKSQNVR